MAQESSEMMTLRQAHRLLDVPEGAPLEVVKQSYRRAARLYHPDLRTALSDADKFHQVTVAYNLISKARKETPARSGRFMGFSFKSKKADEGDNRPVHTLGLEELVARFDRSGNVWAKIEAAHALLERFEGRFESFAIPRLRVSPPAVAVELIHMLGRTGGRRALTAIGGYLTAREKELCVAAFVALDAAGAPGHEIIDRRLDTPSAVRYRLSGLLNGRSPQERRLAREGTVPKEKLRRLSAVIRATGVPIDAFLEGLELAAARP
ncbi:MAG: DnaJ domain-containing protein [Nitrospinae bacterium]|nr:DnaJ domain-containing protein [Nitrospinota bacterium]